MAEEKWKRDLLLAAFDHTAMMEEAGTIYIKMPPDAKYKKWKASDEDQPDLHVGTRFAAIMQDRKGVVGYGLAIVLDFTTDKGFWRDNTTSIVQIIGGSNERTEEWVGRLLSINMDMNRGYYSRGNWSFAGWDWKNYPWRNMP